MKHQSIYNRLRRIEGQVRGIEEMLSKEVSEREVLIQLMATKSSISSAANALVVDLLKCENQEKQTLTKEDSELILRMIK